MAAALSALLARRLPDVPDARSSSASSAAQPDTTARRRGAREAAELPESDEPARAEALRASLPLQVRRSHVIRGMPLCAPRLAQSTVAAGCA